MLTFDHYCLTEQDYPISFSIYGHTIASIKATDHRSVKSLLRAIAGLPTKTHGAIFLHTDTIPLYISNNISLYYNLKVIENLRHWAKVYQTEHTVPIAIKYFDLVKILQSKISNLSIAEQKRVLLSKMFICQSNLWLLYEPFASLAPKYHETLINAILAKCNQGGIILIHDNATACQHHLILDLTKQEVRHVI